jgi:hypothetical protein
VTDAKPLGLNARVVPAPDRVDGVGETYHGEPSEKPNDELKGTNIGSSRKRVGDFEGF